MPLLMSGVTFHSTTESFFVQAGLQYSIISAFKVKDQSSIPRPILDAQLVTLAVLCYVMA